jgi:hypothetical protein
MPKRHLNQWLKMSTDLNNIPITSGIPIRFDIFDWIAPAKWFDLCILQWCD